MEQLFESNLFLILFGVVFYYTILWSMARNKKSKAKKARLAICDGKAERALVYADDKYIFNFTEWLEENKDEMVISVMSSFLLIGFDQLFAEMINRKFFANDPIELGKAVYLFGGIGGDILYRLVVKITGNGS